MVKKVPIGPFHPILEEPEFFELHVDGERVVDIDMKIGWSHRGIELLSEHKTWDQVPFLVERVCGICSHVHTTTYCQGVEALLDLDLGQAGVALEQAAGLYRGVGDQWGAAEALCARYGLDPEERRARARAIMGPGG